ncbi:hypothetical protein CPB84DRAFT_1797679 [Gymnopilus junonius]|uniref:NAD(P)-binding protein n=1 Tax=Gymnopilus junonius TaxID=109634 RepID=A0A9P5N9I6_GYMJU|nr:hypothetical protein CPB84DRAFT_1797679 [Gymnopilus junonius]
MASKRVLVVAGIGNGIGTGAATARLFAKEGYSVALVGRERPGSKAANNLAKEINQEGGQAALFTVPSYSHEDITSAWSSIHSHFPKPDYSIRAALFNVGQGVWKRFLDVTPEDVQASLQTNVAAAFAFSRGAVLSFKENDIEEPNGKRGALIFTGATAGMRGNVTTSAFAAGKFGARALAQVWLKSSERTIFTSHMSAIIDGVIQLDPNADESTSQDTRLDPDSIASSYLFLVNQHRSAWTAELDRKFSHKKAPK